MRRGFLHWIARNRGKVGESPAPTSKTFLLRSRPGEACTVMRCLKSGVGGKAGERFVVNKSQDSSPQGHQPASRPRRQCRDRAWHGSCGTGARITAFLARQTLGKKSGRPGRQHPKKPDAAGDSRERTRQVP